METERKISADGCFLETHEEAKYRFIVTDVGAGELALGLHPAGTDYLPALGRPGLLLAYCLRTGTTLEEAQALCDLLNRSVVLTKAVTSIEINGGNDGSLVRLVVDREAA